MQSPCFPAPFKGKWKAALRRNEDRVGVLPCHRDMLMSLQTQVKYPIIPPQVE